MADRKRTWLSILIAAAIILGILAVAATGGWVYWVTRHVSTRVASSESADDEFARERAHFAGQQPLIDLRSGETTIERTPDAGRSSRAELNALHALAYDRETQELVRADIPFWLVRLRTLLFFVPDIGSLTVDDLERHGPGLIVDVDRTGPHGSRALVWTD
jgi:hypothetical protein